MNTSFGLEKTVTEEEYSQAKQNYDAFIQKLDTGDWKYFVQAKLDRINEEINLSDSMDEENLYNLNSQKQALEWRLDHDITYDKTYLNHCVERYLDNDSLVYQYEHTSEHEYDETQAYHRRLEARETCKYYIENNITTIRESDNRGILLDLLDNYELFILIFFVMIAGSIVSDEFSKGTIKLLLVRPYRRTKILLAKFFVCIIAMLLFIAVIGVSQFIIGGIIQGFESTFVPAVIYNFHTHQIETMSILSYILLTLLAKLPMYLLLMTLAFACSTILNNTAISIVLPLLGYMGSTLLNELANSFHIKAILYFVTPNWDFTQYLFGNLPAFEGLHPAFSITVCLVYFFIMMVTAITVFQKRNIKNV